MKIKSAKSFRFYYKTKVKEIDRTDQIHNENFVGTYHKELGKKTVKGFFEMYHGDKPDIASYLPSILKIAEDGQAIYEFLQNAVDCGSTHFYIFYNEKYFLAINNGNPFEIEGLQSILNIAQTTKKDPDKIGRFGIGFKLAHRLVGKNEGTDELVRQYKGPILFSWSKLEDLESLLKNEPIDPISPPPKGTNNGFFDAPYLLKLLLTNFPSDPNETIKDINYKDKILFPQEELNELVSFLNENFQQHSESLKKNVLKQGSLFFIKLGEDKKKLLDKDYSELVNGIQYSMNTLKRLQKVYINNDDIGKTPLQLEEGVIKKGSYEFENISPEYKEFDIKFAIGFNTIKFGNEKSYEQIKLLKEKPNFYKYFPMGDEINGFGFIVHCDSFSNEANRRKLHEDDVNRNLFPELAKHIIQRLAEYKTNDRTKFLNLYASILLSDIPERQNNKWLRPIFYDKLLNSIQKNIPTENGYSDNAQNVKINKLKLQLNLSNFGLNHIQWFEWDNEADRLLLDEASNSNKLGIKDWDIRDIVENANIENINNWIETCDKETYNGFLKELEESYLRKETKDKIRQIKLFRFSNGKFYSINEIVKKVRSPKSTQFKIIYSFNYGYSNVFFRTPKNVGIVNELSKLGIILSEINTSEYSNILSSIERMPDEKQMYNFIANKCKTNTLSAEEKKKLFLNFINEETKFDNVAEGSLKDLHLFCDRNSQIKPLSKLLSDIKTPNWLNTYKIKKDEYCVELNPFLISESEIIFKEIYQQYQDDIISELVSVEDIKSLINLYQDNKKYFFKEFIIRKDNINFIIDEKTRDTYQVQSADKEARKFLEENCADNLFVLPSEFLTYKDEDGIIKADDLHGLILEFVDVDEHNKKLVDIVKYKAKYKFLQKLSEFRLNSETKYAKEDYEYKILDLACNELKEGDYQKFKNKVVIETEHKDLKLSEIPPFTDKIKIDNYEISLAKILPDKYQNSDYLSSLINQFIGIGLSKERIGDLFGISEEPEANYIFEMFSERSGSLENAEQLAFVLLYNKYKEEIDLKKFKVLTKGGSEYDLTYNFYTKQYGFLVDGATLDDKYKGIKKFLGELPFAITDENQLLEIPYFLENAFICPDLITENLSDEQKLSFVEFLFNQWDKKNKKTDIKNIDWSKISETETVKILGFNPVISVFPNKYALESEQLPSYIQDWISKSDEKIKFLSDFGVFTNKSVIVELRNFFLTNTTFDIYKIEQEGETILFNTFNWLIGKTIKLKSKEKFEVFKKIVEVINRHRNKGQELVIQDEYDFELLEENSSEWKSINNFEIYLFKGSLPKVIKLDEIEDYIFYRYADSDYVVNEGKIYINENVDTKKTMQKVASDDSNEFSFEELWNLFGENKDNTKRDDQEKDNSFLDDVNHFIAELEGTEWNDFVPELKNILGLSVSQPKEKQKLFNLIAKIKLTKELGIHIELANKDYNQLEIGDEKYFIHSARGAFAYIHPSEILKMKVEGYKMALDFSTKSRIKIYETAEEVLQLNTNHILVFQYEKPMNELFSFCEANRDANKHLLIIDKNNSGEKSRALLKLLNIEDDYQ